MDENFYGAEEIEVYPPLIPAPSVYEGSKQKIKHSIKNLFSLRSKRNLLKEIKDSDLVISSGGGYFWSPRKILPGPMFFQNYIHIWLAVVMRKPIIFFPQSFGPISNRPGLRLLKNILEKKAILKISAREATSFDFLVGLLKKNRDKIEICPDMAFSMHENEIPESPYTIPPLPKPIVGITLRRWSFPEFANEKERTKKRNDYLVHLEEACGKIVNHWKGSIVILCQSRGPGFFENDRLISTEFYENLKKKIPVSNLLFVDLPDAIDPSCITDILSKMDFLIATRFHSAIFAFLSGVPAITISYQYKSRGIMEMLDLDHFCLDIANVDSNEILRLSKEILTHSVELRKSIQNKITRIKRVIEDKLEKPIHSFKSI